MQYERPLVAGRLVRRYKRFFAEVEIEFDGDPAGGAGTDAGPAGHRTQTAAGAAGGAGTAGPAGHRTQTAAGAAGGAGTDAGPAGHRTQTAAGAAGRSEVVTAHCANPGSMRTCAEPGGRVWILPVPDPRRKLAWTWELAETGGALLCVNTARGNQLVAEALAGGAIAELTGYDEHRREVAVGASRLDFALVRRATGRLATGRPGSGHSDERCLVEVKTVTMNAGAGTSAFPDSVTARGARHLDELIALRRDGHRAVLLFCAARGDAARVRPADDIDPVYGAALRRAAAAGVEVLAYRCDISTEGMHLAGRIDVDL